RIRRLARRAGSGGEAGGRAAGAGEADADASAEPEHPVGTAWSALIAPGIAAILAAPRSAGSSAGRGCTGPPRWRQAERAAPAAARIAAVPAASRRRLID